MLIKPNEFSNEKERTLEKNKQSTREKAYLIKERNKKIREIMLEKDQRKKDKSYH